MSMIKIDLYKKARDGSSKPEEKKLDLDLNIFTQEEVNERSSIFSAIPVIFIMFFIPIGLKGYSTYKVRILTLVRDSLKEDFSKTISAHKKAQEENIKLNKDKTSSQNLVQKLVILKEITKGRLDEVKSLDLLQSLVPQGVWLTSVKYKKSESEFDISGFGELDDYINNFIESLEKKPYFENVILLGTKTQKNNSGAIKSFQIKYKIRKEEKKV